MLKGTACDDRDCLQDDFQVLSEPPNELEMILVVEVFAD
jgi:hypothetical protein